MNQEAISVIALQVTESQQMEELVKILMNAMKNPHVEEIISIVTTHVEVTSAPMWAVLRVIRRKVRTATDAKESPEDAGQQTLSASENPCQSLSTSCL